MTDLTTSATKIIKRSILSSVYIDDKIYEPFTGADTGDPQFITAKGVYDSFRRENKSIDFYRYDPTHNWELDSEFLFRNRDLLVLDWQLVGEDIIQPETLKIVEKATTVDSLHFIAVYTTADPKKEFPEIFYQIKAYFNAILNEAAYERYNEIIANLEGEGLDTGFFSGLKGKFKELALTSGDTRKSVLEELRTAVQENLGNNYKVFARGLKSIDQDVSAACEVFGYILNGITNYQNQTTPNEVRIDFIGDNFIMVNHTIIQVTNKKEPEPKELFQSFTHALQKISGNLLTLITLEIRSLLRESSGFIGKDADNISDAVLYHQKKKKSGFLEFLMNIVKSHTISYFDYKQTHLESMKTDFWDLYLAEKELQAEVDQLENPEDHTAVVAELLKLNVYYNVLHIKRADGDFVKFGDIFSGPNGFYYLCITAHCDCLQPANIRNNFYFIAGNPKDAKEMIAKGDDIYCSYIKSDGKITAIEWITKPIVFKLAENRIIDGKLEGIDGKDVPYQLTYFSTVKENYTQRMANSAFAHAMRVGIDFAKL